MLELTPIFACRGPVISPGEGLLIISVLLGWLVSLLLFFANACFILASAQNSFTLRHGAILVVYALLTFLLFYVATSEDQSHFAGAVVKLLAVGIPVAIITHFFHLLRSRQRVNGAEKVDS